MKPFVKPFVKPDAEEEEAEPETDMGGIGTSLWLSLFKAGRSLERHALASISTLGMTNTDFAIMEVLLHKGSLPINTIGKKVLLTSGSITTAVDRLAERGLVERIDADFDRRVRLVRLTRTGTKLIKEAFRQHQLHLRRAVSSLTAREQKTLLSLLKKVGKGADALDVLS